ncbi:unnamed protein product [Rotaria sp. Silwood1]|nr:unnamed protein product [Rotaria sp. Silwood1]
MFRRHSVAISPITKTNFSSYKTQSKSNYREWIKFFLSALIPLMIGVFTVVTTVLQQKLSYQQREQDKEDARLFRQQSERQADNLRIETVFDNYVNDVSELLTMKNQTQNLVHIRTKTLPSLRQLDAERKQHLFLFLYESGLIYHHHMEPISSLLRFALLVKANFSNSKLATMDFSAASLVESVFTGALWKEGNVNFANTNLTGAIISNEQLHNSTLYNCILPNGTWGLIYTKNLVVNGDVEQNVRSVSGTEMESIEMSNIVPLDVRSVRMFITFIEKSNSSSSIDEDYCICDNVKFSITKA